MLACACRLSIASKTGENPAYFHTSGKLLRTGRAKTFRGTCAEDGLANVVERHSFGRTRRSLHPCDRIVKWALHLSKASGSWPYAGESVEFNGARLRCIVDVYQFFSRYPGGF